ncbi:MAG: response regulator [Elusimicrobiota bacterium]
MPKLLALILEDEVDIRTMLGFTISRMGFDVLEASTGEQALDITRERVPDLLLLDIMLPGISGFEVLTTLRMDARFDSSAIVMCTALRGLDRVENCLEAGADDYIQKPMEVAVLRTKVERALRKRGKIYQMPS